ncbi:hypothetical protein F4774DRAFT_392288 [Daldinia eschscholtzii]|nr:hypothetical protein F4774DRAFT_392288 [Daldinia eschscholtzii]
MIYSGMRHKRSLPLPSHSSPGLLRMFTVVKLCTNLGRLVWFGVLIGEQLLHHQWFWHLMGYHYLFSATCIIISPFANYMVKH